MNVTKRNLSQEPFNEEKILACIRRACEDDTEASVRVFMNAKRNYLKQLTLIVIIASLISVYKQYMIDI